jgi:hypothetical protein
MPIYGDGKMALAKIERQMAAAGQGCLGKAADDEPVFILRAQDLLSAPLVEKWAQFAEDLGCPPGKVAEARSLATKMRMWPVKKAPD